MADQVTIRLTLTGPFEGQNKVLGRIQFVDGVAYFTGNGAEVKGVTKYYTASWQVKVDQLSADEVAEINAALEAEAEAEEEDEVEDNTAVREDDSEVLGEDAPQEPNDRQAAIIAAVNNINQEKWVEKETNPHPKVKDVAKEMEDPTVTKDEICEVIENWLS